MFAKANNDQKFVFISGFTPQNIIFLDITGYSWSLPL